ncbi:MAG: tetratricopeptide repeat protein, partial [Candidatus Kapabacteria bacterium]|nr:tetratricopeptide repeat protein [Candidatus Kapabacteria bacterium]
MTKNVLAIGVCLVVVISGCSFWDNSTTYFNTYYNAKKLMNETEEEFGYHDEIVKPPAPRVVVPQEPDIVLEKKTGELPKYLKDFQIKPEKLQPVQVKVDSIIIKGSKILAIHPKSSFIDGTLFLMAQAFFYRSEWLPANIKCQELIEQFPNSSYSPDAHLLSSKSYLMQQNIPKANTMLSRTVDVAWQQKRYDVLAEAFRLQAETALDQQDVDAAERPYRQAIVQTDDNVLKARWQNELGLLLYRLGKFERAEKELAKVQSFDPEPVYDYESRVYRAAALMRTKRYTESAAMLDELEKSRKFDDYNKMGFITAERMNWLRITGNNDSLKKMEMYADTANVNSSAVLAANFQTGMKLYREKDYTNARKYFAKARTKRTPVFDGASLLFTLLNQREEKQMTANL